MTVLWKSRQSGRHPVSVIEQGPGGIVFAEEKDPDKPAVQTGNSSPLLLWMVMIRTTSAVLVECIGFTVI